MNAPLCPVCCLNISFDGKPCLRCAQRRSIGWTAGGHRRACPAADLRAIAAARAAAGINEPMDSIAAAGSRRTRMCAICLGAIEQLA